MDSRKSNNLLKRWGSELNKEFSMDEYQFPLWKSVWWFLRKLDIVLPEDPVIPLFGIYPVDAATCNKETCSTMFIAALFIIARS